jgi:hypothetical protein
VTGCLFVLTFQPNVITRVGDLASRDQWYRIQSEVLPGCDRPYERLAYGSRSSVCGVIEFAHGQARRGVWWVAVVDKGKSVMAELFAPLLLCGINNL